MLEKIDLYPDDDPAERARKALRLLARNRGRIAEAKLAEIFEAYAQLDRAAWEAELEAAEGADRPEPLTDSMPEDEEVLF